MSQRNMKNRSRKHKSRKHRRIQYLFFTGILLLATVSASGLLWYGVGSTANKDNIIGEDPVSITHVGMRSKEEIKKTVMETSYDGKQQRTEENYGNTQNAGTDEAWNLMLEMLNAAREGNWGKLPAVVSGYRTQEKQKRLYDEKIAYFKKEGYSDSEAVKQAEQWVAVPGHSEHQLGIAVDINGATYDVYLWLQENSHKYGFIFRYPGSKTDITGTAEEVWHYRYVGKEAAKEIYERGVCLEEYLGAL